jgi:hypothetical protein
MTEVGAHSTKRVSNQTHSMKGRVGLSRAWFAQQQRAEKQTRHPSGLVHPICTTAKSGEADSPSIGSRSSDSWNQSLCVETVVLQQKIMTEYWSPEHRVSRNSKFYFSSFTTSEHWKWFPLAKTTVGRTIKMPLNSFYHNMFCSDLYFY